MRRVVRVTADMPTARPNTHPNGSREPRILEAMHSVQLDQLADGDETYVYRDGGWITTTGYFVNTARGQVLTNKFYQRHGRAPCSPSERPTRRTRLGPTGAR